MSQSWLSLLRGFNPRAREGRDGSREPNVFAGEGVSIHAPVRGATSSGSGAPVRAGGFNPRAREGRDRWWCASL